MGTWEHAEDRCCWMILAIIRREPAMSDMLLVHVGCYLKFLVKKWNIMTTGETPNICTHNSLVLSFTISKMSYSNSRDF
jgi:hypothetical protein